MNKKILLTMALALPMTVSSQAKSFEFPEKLPFGEFSANVQYVSNYIWRGEEQTGDIAIQGGFDWSGTLVENYLDLYIGTWMANLNTSGNGSELDYYGGISGAVPGIEDFLSYDAGLLYYDYPGNTPELTSSGNTAFLEYYGSVGIALPADIGVSYYFGFSPTGYGGNYDYTYHNVSAEAPIPSTPLTLYGGIGFTDSDTADTTTGYGFTDYKVGMSTEAFGLGWGLEYTTTTDFAGTGVDADTTAGGDHVVIYVNASF